MSGSQRSEGTHARVMLVDDTGTHDVFEVIAVADGVVRARTAFLFEIGEELRLRIEQGDSVIDATARVRAHTPDGEQRVTELEVSEQSTPRRMVSG